MIDDDAMIVVRGLLTGLIKISEPRTTRYDRIIFDSVKQPISTLSNLQLLGLALLQNDRVAAACLMDDFGIEFAEELDRPVFANDLTAAGFARSDPPAVNCYWMEVGGSNEIGSEFLRLYHSQSVVNGWSCSITGIMLPDIYTLRDLHYLLRAFGLSVRTS